MSAASGVDSPDPDPRRHSIFGRGASFFARYNPQALHRLPPPARSLRQNGVRVHPQFTHVLISSTKPRRFPRFACVPSSSPRDPSRARLCGFPSPAPPAKSRAAAAPTEMSGGGIIPAAAAAICAMECICARDNIPIPGTAIPGTPIPGTPIPGSTPIPGNIPGDGPGPARPHP